MEYRYENERPRLFDHAGKQILGHVRHEVACRALFTTSISMESVWSQVSVDGWLVEACLDRMIELGEIVETSIHGTLGPHRTFVVNKNPVPDIHSMLSIIEEFRDKSIN